MLRNRDWKEVKNLYKMSLLHFLCLAGLILGACTALGPELLELACTTDAQCLQFDRGLCHDFNCVCTARDNDQPVDCQPKEQGQKLTNFIGGPCPCTQPNTECQMQQDQELCFCSAGYMPSKDKRRCLSRIVQLDGPCEVDSQCHQADPFSVCHLPQGRCLCRTNFEPFKGRCLAMLQSNCVNDTDCGNREASQCLPESNKCACNANYVHNRNMTKCIMESKYGESCDYNASCQLMLGAGGQCHEIDHRCACRTNYYPSEQLKEEPGRESEKRVICLPIIPFGAYCRNDSDCLQQLPLALEMEAGAPAMQCKWGECRCSANHTLRDNVQCVLNRGAAAFNLSSILYLIGLTLSWTFIGI